MECQSSLMRVYWTRGRCNAIESSMHHNLTELLKLLLLFNDCVVQHAVQSAVQQAIQHMVISATASGDHCQHLILAGPRFQSHSPCTLACGMTIDGTNMRKTILTTHTKAVRPSNGISIAKTKEVSVTMSRNST